MSCKVLQRLILAPEGTLKGLVIGLYKVSLSYEPLSVFFGALKNAQHSDLVRAVPAVLDGAPMALRHKRCQGEEWLDHSSKLGLFSQTLHTLH